ncbi:MAG TPA: hypothetical protein ACQGQX_02335 [Xylella taiwanensis]
MVCEQFRILVFVLEVALVSGACLAKPVQAKVQDQLTERDFLLLLYLFRSVDRFGDD